MMFYADTDTQMVAIGLAAGVDHAYVGPVGAVVHVDVPVISPVDLVTELLALTNAARSAVGLWPYIYDAGLSELAYTRSSEMVTEGWFGHVRPGESEYRFSVLIQEAGYTTNLWQGENLAVVYSPQNAIKMWMDSPSHRSNILETRFTRVGLAVAINDSGQQVYTMIFMDAR